MTSLDMADAPLAAPRQLSLRVACAGFVASTTALTLLMTVIGNLH